jgi:hypothetical protein
MNLLLVKKFKKLEVFSVIQEKRRKKNTEKPKND